MFRGGRGVFDGEIRTKCRDLLRPKSRRNLGGRKCEVERSPSTEEGLGARKGHSTKPRV